MLASVGFFGKQYIEKKDAHALALQEQLLNEVSDKKQLQEHYISKSVEAEYLKDTITVFNGLINELNTDLVNIDNERRRVEEVLNEVDIVKQFDWFI